MSLWLKTLVLKHWLLRLYSQSINKEQLTKMEVYYAHRWGVMWMSKDTEFKRVFTSEYQQDDSEKSQINLS